MIYKIPGKSLYDAQTNGAQFIVFSFDGEFALVRSDSEVVGNLETYEESQLSSLFNDPLYKQPCKDC
jgi:hypothetical protein